MSGASPHDGAWPEGGIEWTLVRFFSRQASRGPLDGSVCQATVSVPRVRLC